MNYDVRQAVSLLKRADISPEDRLILTNAILDTLGALPLRDIITNDENGQILLNNEPLNLEKARQLHEYALSALENRALTLIREQAAFTAITIGVHKAERTEQMIFGRAALWWGQQEQKFLEVLAQRNQEPTL